MKICTKKIKKKPKPTLVVQSIVKVGSSQKQRLQYCIHTLWHFAISLKFRFFHPEPNVQQTLYITLKREKKISDLIFLFSSDDISDCTSPPDSYCSILVLGEHGALHPTYFNKTSKLIFSGHLQFSPRFWINTPPSQETSNDIATTDFPGQHVMNFGIWFTLLHKLYHTSF